jgi:hypothetical protein
MKIVVCAALVVGFAVGCGVLLEAFPASVQHASVESPAPALTIAAAGERSDGGRLGISSISVGLDTATLARAVLHGDPGTCRTWTAGQDATSTAPLTWTVEAQLVSTREGGIAVDVRWKTRGPDARAARERQRRIQLERGKPYMLDLVPMAAGSKGTCDRLTLELTFDVIERSEVANALFRYDMWLVHRESGGRVQIEPLRSIAGQGVETPYMFAPLVQDSSGRPTQRSSADVTEITISGTVRARLRPDDGRIDLRVQAWRHVKGAHGSVGEGGVTVVTLASGDTTELVLPTASRFPDGRDASESAGQITAIRIQTTRLR